MDYSTVRTLIRELVMLLIPLYVLNNVNRFHTLIGGLLKGLVYYKFPTVEYLKQFVPSQVAPPKKGKRQDDDENEAPKDFTIPRNAPIVLTPSPIRVREVIPLPFSDTLELMIIMSYACVLTHLVFELFSLSVGLPTFHNSSAFFFCIVTAVLCYNALTKMLMQCGTNEILLCAAGGTVSGILALSVLIVTEKVMDFQLDAGYNDIVQRVHAHAETMPNALKLLESVSFRTWKVMIALCCAVSGALLTLPSFRFARSHLAVLRAHTEPAKQALFHLSFFAPLLASVAWISSLRPVMESLPISVGALRFVLFLVCVVSRASVFRPHLQAYLNLAQERILALPTGTAAAPAADKDAERDKGKREKPKDSDGKDLSPRVSAGEVQKLVANVWSYFCVAALQYLLPVTLMMSFAIMYKLRSATTLFFNNSTTSESSEDVIFSNKFFSGLSSFLAWWICACSFLLNAFALVYVRFVTKL